MNKQLSLLFCFLISFSSLFAQGEPDTPEPEVIDTSVNGQFNTLYKKSNNYSYK